MEETQKSEIQKFKKDDPGYPDKLKIYAGMPDILYLKGNFPDPFRPSAAIVGARACSPYGRMQAFRYAKVLSSAGVQIISGMAYGIDAEAHKGALEGGTPTFAVLAGGVDICYPKTNRRIYERIQKEGGGILSEQPPGVAARNYFFPQRNRIISALADLVLVVEACEKSGSLITAQWALEQGKSVFAIPGMVTESRSLGCHKLIYDGAGIAYTPEILLAELESHFKNTPLEGSIHTPQKKNGPELTGDTKLIYSILDLQPRSIDFIIRESRIPAETVGNLLIEMKLSGLISEVGRHHYVRL